MEGIGKAFMVIIAKHIAFSYGIIYSFSNEDFIIKGVDNKIFGGILV